MYNKLPNFGDHIDFPEIIMGWEAGRQSLIMYKQLSLTLNLCVIFLPQPFHPRSVGIISLHCILPVACLQ